jgi:hypothetical protein
MNGRFESAGEPGVERALAPPLSLGHYGKWNGTGEEETCAGNTSVMWRVNRGSRNGASRHSQEPRLTMRAAQIVYVPGLLATGTSDLSAGVFSSALETRIALQFAEPGL